MFWKNDKSKKLKTYPLIAKLIIFYTLSTIGILFSIILYLHPTLMTVFENLQGGLGPYLANICYTKMITALLLSSAGSMLLGYFIAKNSLNKIRQFSDKIETITATSLHERINPHDWPLEFQTMGSNFNKMLDRLQSSFAQLSQFSSDIAHELRNPLHNLRINTEIALSHKKTPEEYQSLLASNYEEYEHLTKLIENLLFLARIDHKDFKIKKLAIDTQKEIINIYDYFQAMADEKNIQLNHEGKGIIYADPTLFKRVLINLLSNALKYTPHNGKINIKVTSLKNSILISVSDTGTGIDSESLNKIFDRFYRADTSRSAFSGGLGLGLSIVKSIIELHQGQINATSQINVGTSIQFELPHSF